MFFQKINCKACGRRVNKKHRYCQFCGSNLKTGVRRFNHGHVGHVGVVDISDLSNIQLPFPFGRLFEKLTKDLERELGRLQEEDLIERRKVINIRIGPGDGDATKQKLLQRRTLSSEEAERYAKLPREEAKTNIKRFSDKVVYEISVPGVNNLKDVFITKLANSIEIKAFGKDKAYLKLIPVDMHIGNYTLRDGVLVLELGE